jgi:hypothetical protein
MRGMKLTLNSGHVHVGQIEQMEGTGAVGEDRARLFLDEFYMPRCFDLYASISLDALS